MTKENVKATFNAPKINGGQGVDQVTVYIPKKEILCYIERPTGINVILSPILSQTLTEMGYKMVKCDLSASDL